MAWGYREIDTSYTGNTWKQSTPVTPKRLINLRKTYCLVGCEPETMFTPGEEPEGFRWFWWDNSQLPHLRYPSASNPRANKLWTRLTWCGWATPLDAPVLDAHRTRVNRLLWEFSGGAVRDVQQLWGGTQATRATQGKHCLVIRSSDRNYREFYGETWNEYWNRIRPVLDHWGYTYVVRDKVAPKQRINNQTVDQIREGGFDCVLANHSAAASEAVVTGTPVITTSAWNPARAVSTTWEQFVATGEVRLFTAPQVDRWVTQTCAYTWHKTELDTLEWIDTHPDAVYLKEQKYAISEKIC